MDLSALEKKLLDAARKRPPADDVPYAFETRIMARLSALPGTDEWSWWGRALWRGAAACAGVALLCGVWSFYPLGAANAGAGDLEEAVLASVNDADVTW